MSSEFSNYIGTDLTQQIIGAAFEVHKNLGNGFLETVYVNALVYELNQRQIEALRQVPIPVIYKDVEIGIYYADIMVEGVVIYELKAIKALTSEHEAQLLHYLKATGVKVGLLINFGSKGVQVRRLIF